MRKVLIGPSSFGESDPAPLNKLVAHGFDVIKNPFRRKLSRDELVKLLPGVSGLIAGLEDLDREVLRRSELKVISRCGAGISNVDLKAAKEFGIKVFYTPDAPTQSVAELTVGAMICLVRHVRQMDRDIHNGLWTKKIGIQLKGSTVAIIGFGRIGRKVGRLLRSFGASVVAVDPALSGSVDDTPVVSIEDALRQANIVTLHSSGEKRLLGGPEFGIMKNGSYLLNAARGELIDEDALIGAIERKTLAGVWLDTFSQEPYSGRLCGFEQAMLTPHIGSYTAECRSAMELEATENLLAVLKKGV